MNATLDAANRWLKQQAKQFLFQQWHGRVGLRFVNREGLRNWDFELLPGRRHAPGVSAMLRIKNEATKIERCLASISTVFDEIIVVNNGSTDATRSIVERFIATNGSAHIRLLDYPHPVSRCGADNTATPEDSIHSLAYYYNWCLSNCSRQWVFKWDGDMLLASSMQAEMRKVLAEVQRGGLRLWNIKGQTVYFDRAGQAWASVGEINHEVMCFPNSPMVHYRKAELWEKLTAPFHIDEALPQEVLFYEVKDTREDEFSHWTTTTNMSPRKQTEFRNYIHVRDSAQPDSNRFVRVLPE